MCIRKQEFLIYNFLISKYNYSLLFNSSLLKKLTFTIILYYKQKYKYYLFINIIMLLFFVNPYLKTRFLYKNNSFNILQLNLSHQRNIIIFLTNFIVVYFPLIDSFSIEFKFFKKDNIIKFCFLKFPLLFELNILFLSLEYLYIFLNNYKFQLEFHFKKRKNTLINCNFLHILKLPIQIA